MLLMEEDALGVASAPPHVSRVLDAGGKAQVAEPIIGGLPIYVVDPSRGRLRRSEETMRRDGRNRLSPRTKR